MSMCVQDCCAVPMRGVGSNTSTTTHPHPPAQHSTARGIQHCSPFHPCLICAPMTLAGLLPSPLPSPVSAQQQQQQQQSPRTVKSVGGAVPGQCVGPAWVVLVGGENAGMMFPDSKGTRPGSWLGSHTSVAQIGRAYEQLVPLVGEYST